ncbi:MAG: BlaI/MecI/CopY family transcriptional regulator [Bacteroidia bacterium]|nr:BlaI/MecI/CopY family transcriptional regulator [Bacteroidia bacterium]
MELKLLTPLELKVMNILWGMKKAFVKEIISKWPEDAEPAYNTISTIVRILEEKGYVGHDSQGRSHQYFPLITKTRYQKRLLSNVLDNVFSGSLTGMVSSLLDNDKISRDQLEELRKLIENSDKE